MLGSLSGRQLGLDVVDRLAGNPYVQNTGVIGAIEPGNPRFGGVILRAGVRIPEDGSWSQTAHIALSPAERDRLIGTLVAQRDAEQAPGGHDE
jgi:hypothetical protein